MAKSNKYEVTYNYGVDEAQINLTDNLEEALSWREAKKRLRLYYLTRAAALRDVTEETYFNEDPPENGN